MAEPLSKKERTELMRLIREGHCVAGSLDMPRYEATVQALEAQVGTCRGYVRELLEILDDTCAKKWRARLAEIRTEVE